MLRTEVHSQITLGSVSIIVVSKHITLTTTYNKKYAMAAVVVLHGKEKCHCNLACYV